MVFLRKMFPWFIVTGAAFAMPTAGFNEAVAVVTGNYFSGCAAVSDRIKAELGDRRVIGVVAASTARLRTELFALLEDLRPGPQLSPAVLGALESANDNWKIIGLVWEEKLKRTLRKNNGRKQIFAMIDGEIESLKYLADHLTADANAWLASSADLHGLLKNLKPRIDLEAASAVTEHLEAHEAFISASRGVLNATLEKIRRVEFHRQKREALRLCVCYCLIGVTGSLGCWGSYAVAEHFVPGLQIRGKDASFLPFLYSAFRARSAVEALLSEYQVYLRFCLVF